MQPCHVVLICRKTVDASGGKSGLSIVLVSVVGTRHLGFVVAGTPRFIVISAAKCNLKKTFAVRDLLVQTFWLIIH